MPCADPERCLSMFQWLSALWGERREGGHQSREERRGVRASMNRRLWTADALFL